MYCTFFIYLFVVYTYVWYILRVYCTLSCSSESAYSFLMCLWYTNSCGTYLRVYCTLLCSSGTATACVLHIVHLHVCGIYILFVVHTAFLYSIVIPLWLSHFVRIAPCNFTLLMYITIVCVYFLSIVYIYSALIPHTSRTVCFD